MGSIFTGPGTAAQQDGILQTSSGEPVEVLYSDLFTPGGVSSLLKKNRLYFLSDNDCKLRRTYVSQLP